MEKRFRFKKIPLKDFLEILDEFFESGIDYIDIVSSEEEGAMLIETREEYVNKAYKKEPETTDNSDENSVLEDTRTIFTKEDILNII